MQPSTIVQCKCHTFISWSSILDSIESDDKCQLLEAWLNDDGYDEQRRHASVSPSTILSPPSYYTHVQCHEFRWSSPSHQRKLSTQTNFCINRRAAALFIVQNIRDASKHVIDSTNFVPTSSQNHTINTKREGVTYEESFPSLLHPSIHTEKPTVLTARKKNIQTKSYPTVDGTAPPNIPTTAPSPKPPTTWHQQHVRNDIEIMNRVMKSSSSTTTTSTVMSSKNPWGHKHNHKPTPTVTALPTISRDTQDDMLQRLVSIYSILLHRHLLPSSVIEIQFLLSLLSLQEDTHNRSPLQHPSPGTQSSSPSSLLLQRLFSYSFHCRDFAIQVFVKIIPTFLWKWGPHFIHDLIHVPCFANHIPYDQRNFLYQIWHNIIQSTQQTCTIPWTRKNSTHTKNHTEPSLFTITDSTPLSTSLQFFFLQNQQLHTHIGQVRDIRAWKEVHSSTSDINHWADTPSIPFLTLTFDEKRDSKHLYKSKELTSLFQNREQCRDSFLYQLRSFQKLKSSLLDPHQMDHFMQESRIASKDLIQCLFPSNVSWFAEFFCDLLLQIGLVPMQETDADILSHVSDQDKLQKLHKRLTTKAPIKSKHRSISNQNNNHPLSIRSNNKVTAHIQYEYLFPGHQEFFYHFLTWIDSHSFASHLQNRLQYNLIKNTEQPITSSCSSLVAKLCLISRFLGLLHFHPWLNENYDREQDKIAISSCNIPLLELIEEAWAKCTLTITIPWVIDFLRMMVWNERTLRSVYFTKVFVMLRSIMVVISRHSLSESQLLQSNRFLVSLYLECLFADLVGLVEIDSFALCTLPPIVLEKEKYSPDHLDLFYPFIFSKPLLSLSSSYMDDLIKSMFQMITSTTDGQTYPVTVTSKKLKPHSIVKGLSALDAKENGITDVKTRIEDQSMAATHIHKTLAAAFFHHHKEVEQITRFVSNQFIKTLSSHLVELLSPMIDAFLDTQNFKYTLASTPVDLENYNLVFQQVEDHIQHRMIRIVDEDCDSYTVSSIRALTRSAAATGYISCISSAIAASDTKHSYKSLLVSISRSEIKKKVEDFAQRSKKMQQLGESKSKCEQIIPGPISSLEQVVDFLRALQKNAFFLNEESIRVIGQSLASLSDTALKKLRRNFVLKKLYSSGLDCLLSKLVKLLENSHLCADHQSSTDRICDSLCFIDLGYLSQIVQLLVKVRTLGYRSKDMSALLSMFSSTKFVENLVLTVEDNKDILIDVGAHSRSDSCTLSYSNMNDIYSVLLNLMEWNMISKYRMNQILRNLLIHSSSQLVAIRCVEILGLIY